MKNFALIGAAGYVAPRHMRAIRDTGNRLVAAVDLHDSVGILDSFAPDTRFFTEIERFDRHLEKLRRRDPDQRVSYVSVCSPNYLHDAHCRLAMRVDADAICEKPVVISPWNVDQLREIEAETGKRVWTILQLRLHEAVIALEAKLDANPPRERKEVLLTYVTRRGAWYHQSWKGRAETSGGIAANVGIHFFDLLMWLFGPPARSSLHLSEPSRASGVLELERARVRWFLSVDARDLPSSVVEAGGFAHRSLTMDEEAFDFSTGFEALHTRQYEEILAGRGFGLEEARASIDVVHALREAEVTAPTSDAHPLLLG